MTNEFVVRGFEDVGIVISIAALSYFRKPFVISTPMYPLTDPYLLMLPTLEAVSSLLETLHRPFDFS